MDAPLNLLLDELEDNDQLGDADAIYEKFTSWAAAGGRPLYPHQDESFLHLIDNKHVIAATPTGSGKSLIALAAHFLSLARGGRSYYTAPLKALVSEKFFELVRMFGAENVGMVTGDASVNADAPIICCTAEILANQALREGASLDTDMVIIDEFHYYGDRERGWAWQVPLLELNKPQFVLLSATLGAVDFFQADLLRRTGREVELVSGAQRPVPLEMSYSQLPLGQAVADLIELGKYPIYIVHFGQKAALSTATDLATPTLISKRHQEKIKTATAGFKFGKGFGQTLRKLLHHGVGIHHAGMLPRYRLLVERLTQQGLLAAICGTDTLGVGINVPITTVLITSLVKFDGVRQRTLSAREFHQIAGRAGRAGFDEVGWVVVQAPDHVIENRMAALKAGDDPKKLKKLVKKKPPEGQISWSENTFERLVNASPEALQSQFEITHGMVLNVLANPASVPLPSARLWKLATDNHDKPTESNPHLRRLGQIFVSLRKAGVVEVLPSDPAQVSGVDQVHSPAELSSDRLRLKLDLPESFALNQPLSPFALAAFEVLDPDSDSLALDVVSVVEAVLEDPRPLLFALEREARGEAIEAMKRAGIEYEERMAAVEEVTWPKPLQDLLDPVFQIFRSANPWIGDLELAHKSVVRMMVENAMTFSDVISRYDIAMSEGVLLRYLTDAYRALRQLVPDALRAEMVEQIIDWLGALVRSVDSSLLDEWEALADPAAERAEGLVGDQELAFGADENGVVRLDKNPLVLQQLVRKAVFLRVSRFALDDLDGLVALSDFDGVDTWSEDRWADVLDAYWDEYDWLGASTEAQAKHRFSFVPNPTAADYLDLGVSAGPVLETALALEVAWLVSYVFEDPEGDGAWHLVACVDVKASAAANEVVMRLLHVGD
ncbi:DUF3516 domain-containing protein [Gleimia sp. 6138-11-ORH1]|uniref:DEAD/DEAH box helicase n=1 Tax=Gleimia sp. 6138-11-ORH1 TaxID=2973937 RepID=UPI002169F8CE|nr:DUF3516 domain-containing protein [Gleimia sp. 6138-11-ORH1]MCS4484859.1 DUF3516 domain-containing protein [Gleimia sp. 6138-11-ORH1]